MIHDSSNIELKNTQIILKTREIRLVEICQESRQRRYSIDKRIHSLIT